MIIHSIIQTEEIFKGYKTEGGVLQEVSVAGLTLLVEEVEPRQYQLVRLISADPTHYLDPALQPGQSIPAHWLESHGSSGKGTGWMVKI